jgi:hypothetical protein
MSKSYYSRRKMRLTMESSTMMIIKPVSKNAWPLSFQALDSMKRGRFQILLQYGMAQ